MPAPKLYLGSISGTSVDGLDLALIQVQPASERRGNAVQILAGKTVPLPSALRAELLALATDGPREIERLGRSDRQLGLCIGDAVLDMLAEQGLAAADIHAIGSHGQTIRHRPDGELPFTLQIGDANCIAERTGITTVADFRRRDMAAGGQGAPLVPLFHEALFDIDDDPLCVVNIGGISNITLLQPGAPVRGFDTGPGNALLDAWTERHHQQPFDAGGDWAASAQADGEFLNTLLTDAYFRRDGPKSTGREYFNLFWLDQFAALATLPPERVQATLAEFTAHTIARAIKASAAPARRVLVCGGGRHNRHLLARLNALIEVPVEPTEAVGIDGDSLEAAAFAWLAHQTLHGLAGNAPEVTGAEGPRLLGAIYPGGKPDRSRG